MPAWRGPELVEGKQQYVLAADYFAGLVQIDHDAKVTAVTAVIFVPGVDAATVDRCKERVEQMLGKGLIGDRS